MFCSTLIPFFLLTLVSSKPNIPEPAISPSLLADEGTIVTLDYGTFTGIRNETNGIIQYLGIRYADSPTGDLRWRAPVSPPSHHLGEVNATQFGDVCIATTQKTVTRGTSEDCLFGNVYIPIIQDSSTALPVLVWFHGGGYQGGSTHKPLLDPTLLSTEHRVIFVSFEYRLGQFGFLGGPQIKENGVLNGGLLDQRAALRWVQRYIHHFGGDNERVTIWGQSAGAGSTMFHLMGNGGDNEGLFRAAIGDSPPFGFMPAYTDSYIQGIFDQFSGLAGCGTSNDVMSCLRSADVNTLALAGSQTIAARTATLFPFAPIVDGTFLPERPVEAFMNGHFARVPVLFGSNADDGAHWSATLKDASANTSMPNATETTVFNFLKGQYATLTQPSFDRAVSDFYPLSDYNNSFSLQGQQMYGEIRYICSASLITAEASQRGLSAYQYHYFNPHLGSFHKDELSAFFTESEPVNEEDTLLFSVMRDYWTSLVVTGVPSTENKMAASWNPVITTAGSPHILLEPGNIISENLTEALIARCAFWYGLSDELKV